jgi:hypothetical protein
MSVVVDSVSGLVTGLVYGTVAFFLVMLLSLVYRYFTGEKLSSFIGIVFGLGFLGFSGGLLAILEQPSVGGVIQIVAIAIFIVWGLNMGDKIAEKIPKKSATSLLDTIRGTKTAYRTIKMPISLLIHDMVGKPKVPDSLKNELSEREFTLPADLPLEEIINRIKRRLITDWGIGDVELELDQEGKVIHLAISAKERGISVTIPKGSIAIPIECQVIPSNLVSGDVVKIFLENDQIIDKIEVKGVDEEHRVITIIADADSLDTIRGKKASLVVALPSDLPVHQAISVEQNTGEIEDFKFQRMVQSLKRVGVTEEVARKVVRNVQAKLSKMDPPISTRIIKAAVVEELEKEDPDATKKLRKHKLPDLMSI